MDESKKASTNNQDELKMSYYCPNVEEFEVRDSTKYPNRLICIIRVKIDKHSRGGWGTGCFIDEKHILTAAHTISPALEHKKKNPGVEVQGYVKQALNQGKQIGKYNIKFDTVRIRYEKGKGKTKDYAVFEVEPEGPVQKEQKYIPLVAIKQNINHNIGKISLYGYPYQLNKGKTDSNKQSSVFMKCMYGSTSGQFQFSSSIFEYTLPTQKGVSGGPIISFSSNLKEEIVIGIHKGEATKKMNSDSFQYCNFGISAQEMLSEVNDWGYQMKKEPFIFTQSTLFLRNNPKLRQIDTLNLQDKNINHHDAHVLAGFDLSHLKIIILSGNILTEKGVQIFLKRPYPNLQSLLLAQNKIESLESLQESEWNNIGNITTLSLSLNYLKQLPKSIKNLSKIQNLLLSDNLFDHIPDILIQLNENDKKIKRKISLIHNTKIKCSSEEKKMLKERYEKQNIVLIFEK